MSTILGGGTPESSNLVRVAFDMSLRSSRSTGGIRPVAFAPYGCFSLYMPGLHGPSRAAQNKNGSNPDRGASSRDAAERSCAESPLVLIVDDDHGIRESLSMILDNEGLTPMAARHGKEALDWLRGEHRRPDLIILDLMMPVMNGWDFRTAQLSDPQLAAIPTIVLTADSEAEAQAKGLAANKGLRKPVELDALLDAVERLIPPWHSED